VTSQQKQQQGSQLAKDTDQLMKAFTALPVGPDQRQRKIQKERLLNDFSAALNSFQKTQREAASKEREFVARVRAGSRLSGGQPEDNFRSVPPIPSESQIQIQTDAITEEDLSLIYERESAIRQLEADIVDINDIFKDLGMMVHEQGDMIGENLSVCSSFSALQLPQSSRKKICIIVIVLVVVAVVVGLIIWGSIKF
uniref:Syntaxin-7 n=1 Tax=Amphilophus citrinellus TaxID=61819 RepID=A0A3Q0QVI0_AMPCI